MITKIFQSKFASPENTFEKDCDAIMSGDFSNFQKYKHLYKCVGYCDTSFGEFVYEPSCEIRNALWKTYQLTNKREHPSAIQNTSDEFRSLSNGDIVVVKGVGYILTPKDFIKLNIEKNKYLNLLTRRKI